MTAKCSPRKDRDWKVIVLQLQLINNPHILVTKSLQKSLIIPLLKSDLYFYFQLFFFPLLFHWSLFILFFSPFILFPECIISAKAFTDISWPLKLALMDS